MSNLEKIVFDCLEKNQLDEFKNVLKKDSEISTNDICSMFNVCMLEIDTKKDFSKYIWETFGETLSSGSSACLLDSFSTYWSNNAKNFYKELKEPKLEIPKQTSAPSNSTNDNNYSYDPDFLKTIKLVRTKLSQLFDFQMNSFSPADRKILIDVCTFLTFKCAKSSDVLNFYENSFLDVATTTDFSKTLNSVPMNFKSILNHLITNFNLGDKVSVNYLDELLNDSKLKEYTDANVALNIYLLKGKFNWAPLGSSSFEYTLNNNNSLDFSNYDPTINCWEAVLYGLYKANIVSFDDIKNAYNSDVEIVDSVAAWFDYKKAQPINLYDWRDSLLDKSKLLLGDSYDSKNGLSHVMISVPFSEKQLLKMLITKNFNEKPCHLKLYSHWNRYTDKKLGSVSKNDFDKLVSGDLSFRARNIDDTFGPNRH